MLTAALLALLLAIPLQGYALQAPEDTLAAFRTAQIDERVAAYLQAQLDQIPDEKDKTRKKRLLVGDWALQPEGFAFRVPDGMEIVTPVRGTNLMVRDASEDADRLSLTTISVTVTKEKESLERITEERTQSAYASIFQEFELTEFVRETFYGAECVRISYLAGIEPELYVRQYMFDQDGQRYTITLTAESGLEHVQKGLDWLSAFCGSLLFRDEALQGLSEAP